MTTRMVVRLILTDVVLANLFCDLDVRTINSADEETTVETELHVRRSGRFRSGSRDMLTDVGCRDQHFGERHGVVWQEVELQEVLGVWVRVDDPRNVHDEADGLVRGVSISAQNKFLQ